MTKLLIPMVNGGLEDISEGNWSRPGCETCDYGSKYVNELTVYLTKYKIEVNISQMYNYLLSEGDLFKIFIGNIDDIKTKTEEEFIKWFENEIKEYARCVDDIEFNYYDR